MQLSIQLRFIIFSLVLPIVTGLIILYRVQSPNALFMFRDPSFIHDISPDRVKRFRDEEPIAKVHLKVGYMENVATLCLQIDGGI